jgi:hypothetical protein
MKSSQKQSKSAERHESNFSEPEKNKEFNTFNGKNIFGEMDMKRILYVLPRPFRFLPSYANAIEFFKPMTSQHWSAVF